MALHQKTHNNVGRKLCSWMVSSLPPPASLSPHRAKAVREESGTLVSISSRLHVVERCILPNAVVVYLEHKESRRLQGGGNNVLCWVWFICDVIVWWNTIFDRYEWSISKIIYNISKPRINFLKRLIEQHTLYACV